MQFSFQAIINALNADLPPSDNFAFAMARATTIPSDYLLNQFLPQEERPDFHVSGGNMTIYPTMLGQVAMDSPYPPMGAITSETFFQKTTKLAGMMFFTEEQQRELMQIEQQMFGIAGRDGRNLSDVMGSLSVDENGRGDNNTVAGRRLNAILGISRTIIKSHWDTYEWLRSKTLFYGEIDWTFNKLPLKVNYQVPSAYFHTLRDNNDAYQGSASKWWTDIRWLHTQLDDFVLVMDNNTYLSIIDNPVNNISIAVSDGMRRELVFSNPAHVKDKGVDIRDRVEVYVYNKSGTIINAQTGALTPERFAPTGRILAVGKATPEGYELLQGSVEDPDNNLRLGYTHLAPTIEGGFRSGIWSRIFTPQDLPMQVKAETAVNMLPALLNPKRMRVLRTTVS